MLHNIAIQAYTGSSIHQAFAPPDNEAADFVPAPPENLAGITVTSAFSGASPDPDATETDFNVDPESYEERHAPSPPFPVLDTWADTELENPCPRCLTDHIAVDEMNEATSSERQMCERKRQETIERLRKVVRLTDILQSDLRDLMEYTKSSEH
jgi:hypothetical protein